MAKYLISFPSAAMVVPDDEWEMVGGDAHAVIAEAKAAGVYVFGGGIDEHTPPALVSADGVVAEGGNPWAPPLNGGFPYLNCPHARRLSCGPLVSRRPAAAARSCVSSSSIRSHEGPLAWAQPMRPTGRRSGLTGRHAGRDDSSASRSGEGVGFDTHPPQCVAETRRISKKPTS